MTFRALIIGLFATAATVYIVSYAELVTQVIMIGFLQLPPVVIALMFGLVLVNKLVHWRWPGSEMDAAEITVVFVMMLCTSMVASRGIMERLPPMLTSANYYADESNKWKEAHYKNIKQWMVPWDAAGEPQQEIAVDFYEGKDEDEPIPWKPWVRPMLIWGGLFLLVFVSYLCLAALLYRQWAVNERLSFPLIALPLEMIESGREGGFWSSSPMWLGVAMTVFIYGVNGLHQILPSVPEIPLEHGLGGFLPYGIVGYFVVHISLAAIGFFYLLPSQVLFSMWFFFLFARMQRWGFHQVGSVNGASIVQYQTVGAWFALVVIWFWLSRSHIRLVLAAALGREKETAEEILPYRFAFWGLWLSFGGAVWFGCQLGMSLPVSLLMFGVYLFVQVIVMARSTSEAGMPMTEGSFRPMEIYALFDSRSSLGSANLTAMAFFDQMFARDLRGLLITGVLDSQKMADSTGLRKRNLVGVLLGAVVIAFGLAAVLQIWLPYTKGGVNLYSYIYSGTNKWFFHEYKDIIMRGDPHTWLRLKAAVAGAGMTIAIAVCRMQIYWWPFHPLGYALSNTWTMMVFWFPMLVAWLSKKFITKIGGNLGYRKMRPFFLGLIFGEFTMAVFWTLISVVFDTRAPKFPWP